MGKDNRSDQSHIIGEMFDTANISQPVPSKGIPRSLTPDNIQIPAPQAELAPANNGFTVDNIDLPTTTAGSNQEGNDE